MLLPPELNRQGARPSASGGPRVWSANTPARRDIGCDGRDRGRDRDYSSSLGISIVARSLRQLTASDSFNPSTEPRSARSQPFSLRSGRLFERTTVIDSVVAEIKAKIVSGELKNGDMLPSQDEFARALGISRASLREALNRLTLMGLIEMRHGSGTFVRTTRPQDLMNSLSSLLIIDKPSAAELLQARFHVESAVAALAAMNATDEDLDRMRLMLERIEREGVSSDVDVFIRFDTQFHMSIAEAAKNPVLTKVLEIIWELLPQRIRHLASPESIAAFLRYHRAIYDAVAHHDPVDARRQMEAHVNYLIRLNEESEVTGAPNN